jgi:hypothetical protein
MGISATKSAPMSVDRTAVGSVATVGYILQEDCFSKTKDEPMEA